MSMWRPRCFPVALRSLSTSSNLGKFKINVDQLKVQTKAENMYLYAIPLSTRKTFIYCKHNNEIFPNGVETLELKMVNKFHRLWTKFSESPMKINRQIVDWVDKLLSKIPYMETCLLSIPSQKHMRRLTTEDQRFVSEAEIQSEGLKSDQLNHFNLYYPSKLTSPQHILETLKPDVTNQYHSHKKGVLRDLLLMPLTIPFILIPLVPNVPGFYLLFRIYCHIKVMAAVKHFIVLVKDGHLDMVSVQNLDELYLRTEHHDIKRAIERKLSAIEADQEELLLGDDVIKHVAEALGDDTVVKPLQLALQQVKEDINLQSQQP